MHPCVCARARVSFPFFDPIRVCLLKSWNSHSPIKTKGNVSALSHSKRIQLIKVYSHDQTTFVHVFLWFDSSPKKKSLLYVSLINMHVWHIYLLNRLDRDFKKFQLVRLDHKIFNVKISHMYVLHSYHEMDKLLHSHVLWTNSKRYNLANSHSKPARFWYC